METTRKPYGYEKLLTEHKLTVGELPTDAQVAIKGLKAIETASRLAEKNAIKNNKTYKMTNDTASKVQALDKWAIREILDFVEDKDTNTAAPNIDVAEIIEEIKEETPAEGTKPPETAEPKKEETPVDADGVICDKEFAEMLKSGKAEVTLDELKELAPTAYSLIFKHHTNDLTNGITTTYYVLSEVTTNNFKLVKK